ncbi:MAG: 3-hydroxyacyl-CoA dehydrogenase [Microbacteriaceae bacterium]|nr:3-hydroxyacyl-CoA dehydrogenase [Microbacteriaceae bacterium]
MVGTAVTKERIAIVGAGSIGAAFCVLFARAGFTVRLWDVFPDALDRARVDIAERLELLELHELLDEIPDAITSRVSYFSDLGDAVEGAALVQECAPENLELKRDLFARIEAAAAADTILASSSSALPASQFGANLASRDRVLVGHPGNPPYLLPVIEVVPSPETSTSAVETAERLYRAAGLRPVRVRREIEGFVFNRLQGAVLREAYCLVRDGVATVEDIDAIVRDGLGRRWSIIGPFETSDLNTRGGIESHAHKMGPSYERMGAERGQHDPWTPELVAEVTRQRRGALPLDEWEERVRWRDEQLMRLVKTSRRVGGTT